MGPRDDPPRPRHDCSELARRRVATALEGLGELLLAHLDYEEESIGPTLLGWSAWPH